MACRDEHRAEEAERGELVGGHPGRQALAQPIEDAPLATCEDILLDARRRLGGLDRVLGHAWLSSLPSHLCQPDVTLRSEEHTSELQSLMRISYAVFCLKKKKNTTTNTTTQCKHVHK